ncbi:FMN-dependent NADH-azoreductase [Sphingomonas sp. 3P27F8]|uniref:FMN-dependent NADH-azoreductase n=1 Tax=Sphingomonas sp. 3P27F8 TaxID=2502213 RepID=UPI0010F66988|nr:FMN-dependent NADH-azoreductase [Sphingomonas sp. 3P27F8]
MRLLHVDSSITSGNSVSRQLTARLTRRYATEAFDVSVVYRDLARSPLHHLSPAYLQAQFAEPGQHSAPLEEDLSVSSEVLEEFLAADTVVVGAPMYNFTIPSQLKAWIDRLAVAGKTFRYTETGSVGLVEGKKLFIVSTRGGFYGPETALASIDHQEPYLRAVFGFFGVTDLTFIRAEGTVISDDFREKAIGSAEELIDTLPLG